MASMNFLTGGALGLVTLGIVMVVSAVTLSLGGDLLADFQADQTSGSTAYNITGHGLTALTTIGSKQNLIALVGVTIVIIGAIMGIFGFFSGRS